MSWKASELERPDTRCTLRRPWRAGMFIALQYVGAISTSLHILYHIDMSR